jgi:hypothetical protein
MRNAILYWWVGLLLPIYSAMGQGTFQNLNFEAAQVAGYSPGAAIPIIAGLPGWAAGVEGTNKSVTVAYDTLSLGGALISINDVNTGYGFAPIEGTFSAYLFSQGLSSPIATSISQTGLVPPGTMSLLAGMRVQGPAPIVMLGGEAINMIPLASFPTYTLYAGDISAFGGMNETLSFTEPPPVQGSLSGLVLDSIQFSAQPVPEPSELALAGIGALLVGWRVLRRRRGSIPQRGRASASASASASVLQVSPIY